MGPCMAPIIPTATLIGKLGAMCRSIKKLRGVEEHASEEEIRAAALQFVRKVSGYSRPSRVNAAAFDRAVEDIASVSKELLDSLRPARTG